MSRAAVFTLRGASLFCLCYWLLPLATYRIFNTGTAAMLGAGLLLAAFPNLWRALGGHPRLRALVAGAGWCGLGFCLLVSALMVRRAWFNPPPPAGEVSVIVLGSKINGDRPSLMLARRLQAAADYLARNPQAVCVVSGGQGPDEDYPEAVVMGQYLLEAGVAEERIYLEAASTNTRQNLSNSKEVLGEAGLEANPVVLVTDGFHQLRASVFAGAEGLRSYNLSSRTPWGLLPSYWMREILGVSWAWVTTQLPRP